MGNRFAIADTHFGHKGIIEFEVDGIRLRPFATIEQHDECIAEEYIKTVHKKDTVYFLGDVGNWKVAKPLLKKLPGRKVLILGNHDDERAEEYLKVFDDIVSQKAFKFKSVPEYNNDVKVIMTHRPLAGSDLNHHVMGRLTMNVHGHTHGRCVSTLAARETTFNDTMSHMHLNICPEQVGWAPLSFDQITTMLRRHLEGHRRTPAYKLEVAASVAS